MTRQEAMKLAEEWDALQDEAEEERDNGCHAAAERLLNESLELLARLRTAGYDPLELLGGAVMRKLPDGQYRTEAGSKVTLSGDGRIARVEFDWFEEGGCIDCEIGPYPEGEYIAWSCTECGGGYAYLYPDTEDGDEP